MKIKGNVKLEQGFNLFKENIEVGSSIKLAIPNDSVQNCIRIIEFIEHKLQEDAITKIPVFNKVRDEGLIATLDNELQTAITNNEFEIQFADFDIIGTSEIFYSAFTKYKVGHGYSRKKDLDVVTKETLEAFCTEKELVYNDVILDINVVSYNDDGYGTDFSIKELIDYTSDVHKCVLLKGGWYQYNGDYLETLKESLEDIYTEHNTSFDWNQTEYEDYIAIKKQEERNLPAFTTLTDDQFDKKIRSKYYPERVYNQLLSDNHQFVLMDRRNVEVEGQTVEVCNLYKENTIYAIKIGKSSSKLCYAIDQLLTSVTLIKKRVILLDVDIKTACLWLVLERQHPLSLLPNGRPDINSLEMLVLKNKIDAWKKIMRSNGLQPVVKIGYKA